MMHDRSRIFALRALPDDATEAAAQIRRFSSWVLCTGWTFRGLLLLDDAFSEDSALEIAVLRPGDRRAAPSGETVVAFEQIESITASWCDAGALARHLEAVATGEDLPVLARGHVVVDERDGHRCELCA